MERRPAISLIGTRIGRRPLSSSIVSYPMDVVFLASSASVRGREPARFREVKRIKSLLSKSYSSEMGSSTFTIMSAVFHTSSAVLEILAPAAL
jgi:hypothetical protein